MSICRAKDRVKAAIDSKSESTTSTLDTMERALDRAAQEKLDAIRTYVEDRAQSAKRSVTEPVKAKIQEVRNKIIDPYIKKREENAALMFIIDISILTFLFFFVIKLTQVSIGWRNPFGGYTKEQIEAAQNLPLNSFGYKDIQKAEMYRNAWKDYYTYYHNEDGYSAYNIGKYDIEMGNALRAPMGFFMIHIAPYFIVAYLIWFTIKYIKYIIAATWGYFMMLYSYTTAKLKCVLAEKWYIRMVTGWSKCGPGEPDYNRYMSEWKHRFVVVPAQQEKYEYMKSMAKTKRAYNEKYGPQLQGTIWDKINRIRDWLETLRLTYLERPVQEVLIQILDFNKVYVERPYDELLLALKRSKGDAYASRTKSGRSCVCPPRKTLIKRLQDWLKQSKNRVQDTVNSVEQSIESSMPKDTKSKKDESAVKPKEDGHSLTDTLTDCHTYDNLLNPKTGLRIASGTLLTIGVVIGLVYFFGRGTPIHDFFGPKMDTNGRLIGAGGISDRVIVITLLYVMTTIGLGIGSIFA